MSIELSKALIADTGLIDFVFPPNSWGNVGQLRESFELVRMISGAWVGTDKMKMPIDAYLRVSALTGDAIQRKLYDADTYGMSGGSGPNSLIFTKRACLGTDYDFELHAMCILGTRQNGPRLKAIYDKYGVTPVPDFTNDPHYRQLQGITAAGYVFLNKEHKDKPATKKIAGFLGNGRDLITPADIALLFAKHQYKFCYLTGAAIDKFGKDNAEILLEKAIEYKTDIILSMPTQSRESMSGETRDYFRKAAEHSIIISGNIDELMNTFATPRKDEAIAALQVRMKSNSRPNAVAIVTDGRNEKLIITKDQVISVPTIISKDDVCIDPLGAGDSFLGGFVTAILRGSNVPEAIEFGNIVASWVVKQYGAQLYVKEPREITDDFYRDRATPSTIITPLNHREHALNPQLALAA